MANVKAQGREDRLKAALRENLRRRKAQARGREQAEGGSGAPADEGRPDGKAPSE
jgi:hypothetical protein